jgi:hypothetical protein
MAFILVVISLWIAVEISGGLAGAAVSVVGARARRLHLARASKTSRIGPETSP